MNDNDFFLLFVPFMQYAVVLHSTFTLIQEADNG